MQVTRAGSLLRRLSVHDASHGRSGTDDVVDDEA